MRAHTEQPCLCSCCTCVTQNHAKSSCGGQAPSVGAAISPGAWVTLWGGGQQEEGTSRPWVHVSSLESVGQEGNEKVLRMLQGTNTLM